MYLKDDDPLHILILQQVHLVKANVRVDDGDALLPHCASGPAAGNAGKNTAGNIGAKVMLAVAERPTARVDAAQRHH
jgi:hypothetical protein